MSARAERRRRTGLRREGWAGGHTRALDIRQGDLFATLEGERFDVLLFNPPYYRGVPRDGLDHAWRSADVPERFAAGLAAHLAPNGYALVVLSSDGESGTFERAFEQSALGHEVVARRDFINEVMTVHRVRAC